MSKIFLMIAAFSGALCVILGAFGAHALKQRLPVDQLAVFETGVRYQFFHTIALIAVAILISKDENSLLKISGFAFIIGIVLFSGSLYLLSIRSLIGFEMKWLGPVTPLGGIVLSAGWIYLFMYALKSN
jgi:uncharacterized membrane protein YgdD (TMEM256/DUF423 family)